MQINSHLLASGDGQGGDEAPVQGYQPPSKLWTAERVGTTCLGSALLPLLDGEAGDSGRQLAGVSEGLL